jgi:hypothetical protein
MDHSSDFLNYLVRVVLWTFLPWGLGALGVAGALSLTPFGRGIIDYLRSRRRDTELLEAVLQEISELRSGMLEVSERLDAAETRYNQERGLIPGPAQPGQGRAVIPTPP